MSLLPHPAVAYVTGDATAVLPQHGPVVLMHVCNAAGGWGRGFVGALSDRYRAPEAQYRAWFRGTLPDAPPFALGETQFVIVRQGLVVANMLAQTTFRPSPDGTPKLRYDALALCLQQVGDEALRLGASVHAPRLGCGLAGGDWGLVEELIREHLLARDVAVTIYDWPATT